MCRRRRQRRHHHRGSLNYCNRCRDAKSFTCGVSGRLTDWLAGLGQGCFFDESIRVRRAFFGASGSPTAYEGVSSPTMFYGCSECMPTTRTILCDEQSFRAGLSPHEEVSSKMKQSSVYNFTANAMLGNKALDCMRFRVRYPNYVRHDLYAYAVEGLPRIPKAAPPSNKSSKLTLVGHACARQILFVANNEQYALINRVCIHFRVFSTCSRPASSTSGSCLSA